MRQLPILGYRIGKLGYITDMPPCPMNRLSSYKGKILLVMNALRVAPHNTIKSLSEALAEAVKRGWGKGNLVLFMSHRHRTSEQMCGKTTASLRMCILHSTGLK